MGVLARSKPSNQRRRGRHRESLHGLRCSLRGRAVLQYLRGCTSAACCLLRLRLRPSRLAAVTAPRHLPGLLDPWGTDATRGPPG